MKDTENHQQTNNSYTERDQEIDTTGQKGGTSQQRFEQSPHADRSSEMNETDESLQEDSSSW